jgi:diaminopimelate epimerase
MRRKKKPMRVPYLKMHGTGNQILVVDQRSENLAPPGVQKLRELGNEQTGPGFDQMMWIGHANDTSSIASYRVFNSDGSEVEQCGNGVRCVARYLADFDNVAQEFSLQGPAGTVSARLQPDGQVAVSMGTPDFEPANIPFDMTSSAASYTLDVGKESIEISAVSMGNPHCVIFVDEVDEFPVAEVGPKIESHRRFPKRTNTEFVQVLSRGEVSMRTWERGAGETLACGTGASAACVAGALTGKTERAVNVNLLGGYLELEWAEDDHVYMTGPAEEVFTGEWPTRGRRSRRRGDK